MEKSGGREQKCGEGDQLEGDWSESFLRGKQPHLGLHMPDRIS